MPFGFEDIEFPEYETSVFSPGRFGGSTFSNRNLEPQGVPKKNPWLALMESIKPQPTPGLDQYRSHVQNVPRMEDYSPSKWRRFGAALAGGLSGATTKNPGAAYELSRRIVEQPYQSALENWDIQEKGLRQAASREVEDQKAQNQYMKNIFDLYIREQTQQETTKRTGITAGAGVTRAEIAANASNFAATLKANAARIIAELNNKTKVDVANIGATTAAAGQASAERRTATTAAATRYSADQRRAGQEYSADRRAEDDETARKSFNAAQLKQYEQQIMWQLSTKYQSLFGPDGAIVSRIGSGNNPTGELIRRLPSEIDEELLPTYNQFLIELKERMDAAEEALNQPRSGIRLPPTPATGTPNVPTVGPPGSGGGREVKLPNGKTITVKKVPGGR